MTAKTTKYITISSTAMLLTFLYYLISAGYLTDTVKMKVLIQSFGIFAPIFFLILQIIQVIIPIIPGGVSSGIGIILFGPIWGFILNYIGLMIGSILVFLLVRKYGKNFILKFTDKNTYNKYINWLNKKNFDRFFAFAIFVPGLPDDILCMIAGLTNMSIKKYITINILCKPFSLIVYSWGIKEIVMCLGNVF